MAIPLWLEYGSKLAEVATALGIFLAFWQIRFGRKQATTTFEDSMAKEYRELAAKIPTKALIGEDLNDEEYAKTFDEFYHYIDLSNEQVFLRQRNRIGKETWIYWVDGIQSNLARPAFKRAWREVKEKATESFKELRRLEEGAFQQDPLDWREELANRISNKQGTPK